jgi:hypothetical protein
MYHDVKKRLRPFPGNEEVIIGNLNCKNEVSSKAGFVFSKAEEEFLRGTAEF